MIVMASMLTVTIRASRWRMSRGSETSRSGSGITRSNLAPLSAWGEGGCAQVVEHLVDRRHAPLIPHSRRVRANSPDSSVRSRFVKGDIRSSRLAHCGAVRRQPNPPAGVDEWDW